MIGKVPNLREAAMLGLVETVQSATELIPGGVIQLVLQLGALGILAYIAYMANGWVRELRKAGKEREDRVQKERDAERELRKLNSESQRQERVVASQTYRDQTVEIVRMFKDEARLDREEFGRRNDLVVKALYDQTTVLQQAMREGLSEVRETILAGNKLVRDNTQVTQAVVDKIEHMPVGSETPTHHTRHK